MVTLIAGKKGSGKSKEIVRRANEMLNESKGITVFVDDDDRAMFNLNHDVRFINVGEFPLSTVSEFLGFVCGLISNNYDIETVFIDGIMNAEKMAMDDVIRWMEDIEALSERFKTHFVVTLNIEAALPEALKKYVH